MRSRTRRAVFSRACRAVAPAASGCLPPPKRRQKPPPDFRLLRPVGGSARPPLPPVAPSRADELSWIFHHRGTETQRNRAASSASVSLSKIAKARHRRAKEKPTTNCDERHNSLSQCLCVSVV